MPYDGTFFAILVAGPSDVEAEKAEVVEAIRAWNQQHAEAMGLMMDPRMWESHSAPELGGDAQAVINRQMGDRCDAIIAVLGTRMGTPTPRAISGTAEEIDRFHRAGKRVMVYFSSGPIPREGFSSAQFSALEEFRDGLRAQGLLGEYASTDDLRQKLNAHLSALGHRFRELLNQGEQRPQLSSVRSALALEIAANLRTLTRLWNDANRPLAHIERQAVSEDLQPAIRLSMWEAPRWRRTVFDQQLPTIVDALTAEELAGVDIFYDRLSEFDLYRGALSSFRAINDRYNLRGEAMQAWLSLRYAVEAILRDGHPLPDLIPNPSDERSR